MIFPVRFVAATLSLAAPWAVLSACNPSDQVSICERGQPCAPPQPKNPDAELDPNGDHRARGRAEPAAALQAAQAVFEAALAEPALPGDAALEDQRAVLLMRTKGEPAFFVRAPALARAASEAAAHYRSRLLTTAYPWDVLEQLLPSFRANPELGRAVLLRESYLYATRPELAFALVSLVGPEHLFREEEIWVQRGARVMRASRSAGGYSYEDGPFQGQPVKLLMFDRIGAGPGPHTPALHRDFRALVYELGFDRAHIRHITERHILADLRYGGSLWVRTLLKADGARLSLEFEEPRASELQLLRQRALGRLRGVQALRHAMLMQVEESLPFDEPRRELGQEDGKLRRSFRFVYEQGRDSFRIRNERYPVFDAAGRPLTPQVCIDFLLDTFERASGTWWQRRDAPRSMAQGRLNFEDYVPRDVLRRAQEFIDFSRDHPELFEVVDVPAEHRVPQGDKARFFAYLSDHPDLFEAGDIALIRGLTPWDHEREHYHSFFIYETDPVSGVPIAIAGNASTPAIWSWESEARRTPLRTLHVRIRPTTDLLERVAGEQPLLAPTPPPLVVEPRPGV